MPQIRLTQADYFIQHQEWIQGVSAWIPPKIVRRRFLTNGKEKTIPAIKLYVMRPQPDCLVKWDEGDAWGDKAGWWSKRRPDTIPVGFDED